LLRILLLKFIPSLLTLFFISSIQAKELTLEVVSEHWPPFIIQNFDNKNETSAQKISGIVTEKIHHILSTSEINYTIKTYPWARSYYLALNKPNVLIYSIYKTEQRTPFFEWFCPVHQKTPINIYKLKSNKSDISSLSTLGNSIIGVLRSDNSHSYMLKHDFLEGENLIVSSSEENNIRNLLNQRIDAVIQSKESLIYRLQNTGFTIDDFEAGFELHQNNNTAHCMALSKSSSPEMIAAVKHAFTLWLNK
jgi:polar amino acid transport system substrate-binding protein